MTREEKTKLIQVLKEDELREKVLVPLFSKMGFIDPIIHHHNNEKGKDIVIKEYDTKFKKTLFLAVVVKIGDITGSASGNSNYFTLLNQIRQALNEPYKHIYELKEVYIDQVIVVISGEFIPTSLESIYGTLKSEKLDKGIREPIDINKLLSLIEDHFPEYWNEYEDERKSLIEQRNKLLNNLSKVTKLLFPEIEDQENFLIKASQLDLEIDLFPYKTLSKYVANIGYNKINVDEIDEYYSDTKITNNNVGDIKSEFFRIKERAIKVLYEFDEVVQILKDILNEKNPEKLLDITLGLHSYISTYGGSKFDFSTHDLEYVDDFGYAIKDYQSVRKILEENGAYSLYHKILDKINTESLTQLISFFKEHPKSEIDVWLGLKIKFDLKKEKMSDLNFYKFKEVPKTMEPVNHLRFKSREIERFSLKDNSEIKIEIAINNYGFIKGDQQPIDKKAKEFVWHFERAFESKFLEIFGYEKN
jgi:hypothetical protein